MHVVVNAVAPRAAPSVGLEQVLDHGRGVVTRAQVHGTAIDDQRPSRVVRDQTVILETDGVRLSGSRESRSAPLAGSSETCGALRVFLQVFKNRHDRPPLKLRADNRSTAAETSPGQLQVRS